MGARSRRRLDVDLIEADQRTSQLERRDHELHKIATATRAQFPVIVKSPDDAGAIVAWQERLEALERAARILRDIELIEDSLLD
jgi:hypothetical protein